MLQETGLSADRVGVTPLTFVIKVYSLITGMTPHPHVNNKGQRSGCGAPRVTQGVNFGDRGHCSILAPQPLWPRNRYSPIPYPSPITLSHPISIISTPQPSQIHPISIPPHPLSITSPISASIPCPFHILIPSHYHPSPIPYAYFIPNPSHILPMLIPCPSQIYSIF